MVLPNDDDNYVNTDQNKPLAVEMAAQAAKELVTPGKGGTTDG